MSAVLAADFHRAVFAVWNASTLNALFKSYWPAGSSAQFSVLHGEEAAAGQPWPYCVIMVNPSQLVERMSSRDNEENRREIRNVPFEFHVHARLIPGKTSAKTFASELMEEITKVFGGHPVEKAVVPVLEHGNVLQTDYDTDYPVRDGDKQHQWIVRYRAMCDIPVAQ